MERSVPIGVAGSLLAAFFFGWCIVYSRGAYSEPSLTMVIIGFVAVMWRYAASFRPGVDMVPARVVAPLAWAIPFATAFFSANDAEPIIYPIKAWAQGRVAQAGLLVLLLTYLPFFIQRLKEPRWLRHARFAMLALCIAVAGRDVINASPHPFIDVWTVQQLGAEALSQGKNPYQAVAVHDTGPRQGDDVPYVYPPMQAYLTLPAWLIAGDVRYAMLTSLILLGFLLRALMTRGGGAGLPSVLEDAPALFVWCTPKLFFILEQSWVDPVQVMLCTAMLTAAVYQRPTLTAILAGCVLAAKQTMFLFVGLFGLGLRFDRRQWAIAGSVALATFLPWLVWDFKAWKHANFDFLNALPVRGDALTFITWFSRKLGVNISPAFAFPAALAVAAGAAWKMRQSLARLAAAAVATFTVFFVINKWAFANYYFLLVGLSSLAAAMAMQEADSLTSPKEERLRRP